MKTLNYVLATLCLLVVICIGLWNLARQPTFQFFGELLYHGETSDRTVALTFDDGPSPLNTPEVLAILNDNSIKATFFMIGKNVERFPQLAHQVLEEGHQIGNHTSPNQHPNKDWLKICVTSRATSKIRAYVRAEENKRALSVGQDLLEKELRRYNMSLGKVAKGEEFEKYLKTHKLGDANELYSQLGYGKVTPQQVIQSIVPDAKPLSVEEPKTFIGKVFKAATERRRKSGSVIKVNGMSDILVRYGKCCTPIPGDPIVGFISRGRGITVHSASCPKAFDVDQDRKIDVEWTAAEVARQVRIRVVSQNILGILNQMTEVFRAQGVDIQNAQVRATKDQTAISLFDINIKNTTQLTRLIQEIQKIKGIIGVERVSQA